jgi:hypothetical protein
MPCRHRRRRPTEEEADLGGQRLQSVGGAGGVESKGLEHAGHDRHSAARADRRAASFSQGRQRARSRADEGEPAA